MKVIHHIEELRALRAAWGRAGESLAFVPTMGSLHAGHLSLVEDAKQRAQRVIVSIFVNPLQFAAGEDFDCYPRELQADCDKLLPYGVDVVFAPADHELYPQGRAGLTQVRVPGLSEQFCGQFRAGHFEGVATVVSLLFNIVQPDIAIFGQKDYQQLSIIRRMANDLHMPVEVVGVRTKREASGLAMSSRNQFLNDQQKEQAAVIYRCLQQTAEALGRGDRGYAVLEKIAAQAIVEAGLEPQFFAIRTREIELPTAETTAFVVLAAALLGPTRLIDNLLC